MSNESKVITHAALKDCEEVFQGLKSLVDVGSEKLNFVGRDMVSHPIPPADAILLKWILIFLSEEECLVVLKKCREAILSRGKGGKVIIIEMVVGSPINMDKEISDLQLALDIRMMTMSGKQRTFKEWEKLFMDAGFSHYKSTLILGERYVIEVFP
ncbi:hypothetical protein TIFTF001_037037 [Ficus carica]|uniref:O-methyltransferase C-terminal domain-containing protein n=1 Tax=Ficus carica TaxID=3494 RepID=A0AA88E4I5_FICCA|nr:hypothetical protein TIFTF001_037037 [Ficus carica]